MRLLCVLLLLAPAWAAAEEPKLELHGQILPRFRWMTVTIQSANAPFSKQTLSGSKGKFKFKKLTPGPYIVAVYHPRWGELRRSVAVTPSFADEKGRVGITIVYRRSQEARERMLERRNMVSLRELTVSDKARSQYRKASKKLEKKDVESAIEHLKKAVEISPQFVAAWNQLGTIAYQEGDPERAEAYFREALDLDSEAFAPLVNLGGALITLRRYPEALTYNKEAVTLRPDDPLANSQLGRNYFHLGNLPEAVRYLRKAKGIDPSHFSLPQMVLAEVYLRQGRRDRAVRELEELMARHPDGPAAEMARETIEKLRAEASVPNETPTARE